MLCRFLPIGGVLIHRGKRHGASLLVTFLRAAEEWTAHILRNASNGALDLALTILVMVYIERHYGYYGLGIYSYILSLTVFARYFLDWGVSRNLEARLASGDAGKHDADELLASSERTLLVTGGMLLFFTLLAAPFGAMLSMVDESVAVYPLIGLAVILHNYNHLRLCALNGMGRNELYVKLMLRRRVAFVVAIYFLVLISVPPSFLVLAFVISDVAIILPLKRAGFPLYYASHVSMGRIVSILAEGGKGLFVDDALRFVLFADFLILGFFVSSVDLGVYSEATVLGRFFLLIPIALRPVIRRKLAMAASDPSPTALIEKVNVYARVSFFFHSAVAVLIVLHFREFVGLVFVEPRGFVLPVDVFDVLLPGLLCYSTLCVIEPIYGAVGRVEGLRSIVITVMVINIALNMYLIPYSGYYGAASATTITLFVYFLLFGRRLEQIFPDFSFPVIVAGASAYLVYRLFSVLDSGFVLNLFAVPVVLLIMFWLAGYFSDSGRAAATEMSFK